MPRPARAPTPVAIAAAAPGAEVEDAASPVADAPLDIDIDPVIGIDDIDPLSIEPEA